MPNKGLIRALNTIILEISTPTGMSWDVATIESSMINKTFRTYVSYSEAMKLYSFKLWLTGLHLKVSVLPQDRHVTKLLS